MLSEPPGADPHAGWCGRGQGKLGLYPILRAPGGAIPPGDSPGEVGATAEMLVVDPRAGFLELVGRCAATDAQVGVERATGGA